MQVCIKVDSLNNFKNKLTVSVKKKNLEKVHSTLVMFLCTKIITASIMSHLYFSAWVNRTCFYKTKTKQNKNILEQINIFFFYNIVYIMSIKGSFLVWYSHTMQIAAVNERKFYQILSCQRADVHLTQRTREITA